MTANFMIYGATGYVGKAIAHLAVKRGLKPILAGRNQDAIKALARELSLDYRVFALDETEALDSALKEVSALLHCAGPYIHTYKPVIESCLRQGTHYLDISGELPVYAALEACDSEAKERGVMILPGVGFDVAPTDCLAVHLKEQLPSANQLTLAFQSKGPASLPPGTMKTMIELIPFGNRVRINGQLVKPEKGLKKRFIDFGDGPVEAVRLTWGDVFTAYHSTGIPNIEVYAAFPKAIMQQMGLIEYFRPLFSLPFVQKLLALKTVPGSTKEEMALSSARVWGEVQDEQGNKKSGRLYGPEAGLTWTSRTALDAIERVLSGDFKPGYQTPAKVFGAEFVLDSEEVSYNDMS